MDYDIRELHKKPTRSLNAYERSKLKMYYERDDVRNDIFDKIVKMRHMFHGTDYAALAKAHNYVWKRFIYTSDEDQFKNLDFWDTLAFEKLIHTGELHDDCDGFGYALLEFAYRILGFDKKDMYWSACAAETGEGHFVSWFKTSDKGLIQAENRYPKPMPIKFFREMGYEYWVYARMDAPLKTKKAQQIVMNHMYHDAHVSVSPAVTMKAMFALHRSKTLLKEWGTALIGAGYIALDYLQPGIDTLKANSHYLQAFLEPKYVAGMMIVLSLIGVYIRVLTTKPVDTKRDYDG